MLEEVFWIVWSSALADLAVVSWVGSFLAFVLSAVLELVSAGRTDGVSFALVWMEDFSGATVPGGISAAAGTGVPTACPTAFMIFGS